jgi:hypothetical protein
MPKLGAGAHDADGDLAPVGDQYFLKHGHRFFDKNNAKSYHCWLMFNRVRHVDCALPQYAVDRMRHASAC